MPFKEYEDPNELKHLQNTTKIVIEEFIRVCNELEIDYFAYAGTAIGAVRHHGFIPWDDDVDVALLRKDYEKFLREGSTILHGPFRIDNSKSQKNYPSPFSYLALKGTRNIPEFFEKCEWKRTIGIDVFPLDKVSCHRMRRWHQIKGTFFWGRIGFLRATPEPYIAFDGIKRSIVLAICHIAHSLLSAFRVSPEWIQKQWERCARLAEHEDADLVADFSDKNPLKWSASIDELFPTTESQFEGIRIKLPQKWDTLLTRQYGEYMKYPPVEQRKNHYPIELDFGIY